MPDDEVNVISPKYIFPLSILSKYTGMMILTSGIGLSTLNFDFNSKYSYDFMFLSLVLKIEKIFFKINLWMLYFLKFLISQFDNKS